MPDSPDRPNDTVEFDALAELFLGGNGHVSHMPPADLPPNHPGERTPEPSIAGTIGTHATPATPGVDSVIIEAIVIGHLPVRTGPWLAQYAGQAARRLGEPVGLVRRSGGHTRVDAFGLDRPETALSLEDALGHLAGSCSRVIVQVSEPEAPWLMRRAGIGAVTLLATGNEAAMVDAYRVLKGLASEAESALAEDDDSTREPPRVGLAIIGSDEARSDDVARRLGEATKSFLGREIDIAEPVREMGPTGGHPLFHGETTATLEAMIERLSDPGIAPAPRNKAPRPAPAMPTPTLLRDALAGVAEPAPEPIEDPAPAPAPTAHSGDLAAHVDDTTPIDLPYPDDESVEFAIDSSGGLHVLRRDDVEGDALAALTGAAAWASRNAALINLAIGTLGPLSAAQPILHMFTQRPRRVRGLIDAEVRLHALAPVPQDRQWVALELN